jgi:hypothetical protein
MRPGSMLNAGTTQVQKGPSMSLRTSALLGRAAPEQRVRGAIDYDPVLLCEGPSKFGVTWITGAALAFVG